MIHAIEQFPPVTKGFLIVVLFGSPITRDSGGPTKGLLLLALRTSQRREVGAVCCLLMCRRAKIMQIGQQVTFV